MKRIAIQGNTKNTIIVVYLGLVVIKMLIDAHLGISPALPGIFELLGAS